MWQNRREAARLLHRDEMNSLSVPNSELSASQIELRSLGHQGDGLEEKDGIIPDEIEEKKYEQQDATVQEALRLEWDKRCYFRDGKRQIDYVLAYEEDESDLVRPPETVDESSDEESEQGNSARRKNTLAIIGQQISKTSSVFKSRRTQKTRMIARKKDERRKKYLHNLQMMGLDLEMCTGELGNTKYVLVHAPFELLEKQAQLLTVKLPVKRSDVEMEKAKPSRSIFDFFETIETVIHNERNILPGVVDRWLNRMKIFEFDEHTNQLLNEPDYFTSPYSSDRRQHFVNWDRPDLLFPNAERCRMVYDLLIRARYDSGITEEHPLTSEPHYRVGIERLLASGTFSAAYPLHQEMRNKAERRDTDLTQRELLYAKWASFRNFFKYQPLDLIKRYFGTKVGLYFAWLGYYTRALYPASLIGIVALLFGWYHLSRDIVSNDICDEDGFGGSEWVCPHCVSHGCNFARLKGSCLYAKASYLFDNTSTVIFAVCMTVWATLFLEGWKRYHAEVAWKWGLMDFVVEEERARPEFQLQVKTKRFNPITQKDEPYLTFQKKFKNFIGSGATVLFFICLVLAVVFGMVVYRVIAYQLLNSQDQPLVDQISFLLVSITAATLNMFVILPMNTFYNRLAHWLTRWECPRTQAEFDNQYTFKVFLFQFVNYYSSLFYIAFFKGAFTENPKRAYYGITLEGCDSAGCFAELVIQLVIIMCGKQFFSAFMETLYPYIMGKIRQYKFIVKNDAESRKEQKKKMAAKSHVSRWETDYYLSPVHDQFLFDEYLEMVLQFGFVTLFVAAFPLAPLFALFNNIMEIRLDAKKFLLHAQRPLPAMAKNIGVWLPILDGISKCSVIINALVIAFTSDFVPRTYYFFTHDYDMSGYANFSLSYFDIKDFREHTMGRYYAERQNVSMCRYRGYFRFPCANLNDTSFHEGEPCSHDYERSQVWWHIFAYRLLFIVIFEHLVFVLKSAIAFAIPDIPEKIFIQQQREKYLAREALIAQGVAPGIAQKMERRVSVCGFDSESTAYQPGSEFGAAGGDSVGSTVRTVIPNLNHNTGIRFQYPSRSTENPNQKLEISINSLHTAPSDDSFITAIQYDSSLDLRPSTRSIAEMQQPKTTIASIVSLWEHSRPLFTILVLVVGVVGGLTLVITVVYFYRFCLKKRPPLTTTCRPEQKRDAVRSEASTACRPLPLPIKNGLYQTQPTIARLVQLDGTRIPQAVIQKSMDRPILAQRDSDRSQNLPLLTYTSENLHHGAGAEYDNEAHARGSLRSSAELLPPEDLDLRRPSVDGPKRRQLPSIEHLEVC
ncbi:unnamed protein product, partial [Mesorhabditis belari]|uniref:Anoctamin n=1 Tax=Mesorhabditis belari TaxID=2138241 RepID=A0AAF3EW44_9BILA